MAKVGFLPGAEAASAVFAIALTLLIVEINVPGLARA
jgi:hypothetical protein